MTDEERMIAYARQIKDGSDAIALLRVQELFEWGVEVGKADLASQVVAFAKARGGLR